MPKLDLTKYEGMVLPEWDVCQAAPVLINLGEKQGQKLQMLFEIPSCRKYFQFESYYLALIAKYLPMFASIKFLELKDFIDLNMVKVMVDQVRKVCDNNFFQKDFIKFLSRYFKPNWNIKKTMDLLDPLQVPWLFIFIHKVIETVKKKFPLDLAQINRKMSETFSIFSSTNSKKIVPRF